MSEIIVDNDAEIIWRYETPLKGAYLAKALKGGISQGLIAPVSASNAGGTFIIEPFDVFITPSDDPYSLVKIHTKNVLSVTLPGFSEYAYVMIRYNQADVTVDLDVLTSISQLKNYSGVLLATIDNYGHVFNQAADFTENYWLTKGYTGFYVRPELPRESETQWSPTRLRLVDINGPVENRIPIQLSYEAVNEMHLIEQGNSFDIKNLRSGYYAIGFLTQTTGTIREDAGSLRIINDGGEPAASFEDIIYDISRTAIAAFYKPAEDSLVHDRNFVLKQISTTSAGSRATSVSLEVQAPLNLVNDNLPLYESYLDANKIAISKRPDLESPKKVLLTLEDSSITAKYHQNTPGEALYIGNVSRLQADYTHSSIGQNRPRLDIDDDYFDLQTACWYHCTDKTTLSNRKDFIHLFEEPECEVVPINSYPNSMDNEDNPLWKEGTCIKTTATGWHRLERFKDTDNMLLAFDFCQTELGDLFQINTENFQFKIGIIGTDLAYNANKLASSATPITTGPSHAVYLADTDQQQFNVVEKGIFDLTAYAEAVYFVPPAGKERFITVWNSLDDFPENIVTVVTDGDDGFTLAPGESVDILWDKEGVPHVMGSYSPDKSIANTDYILYNNYSPSVQGELLYNNSFDVSVGYSLINQGIILEEETLFQGYELSRWHDFSIFFYKVSRGPAYDTFSAQLSLDRQTVSLPVEFTLDEESTLIINNSKVTVLFKEILITSLIRKNTTGPVFPIRKYPWAWNSAEDNIAVFNCGKKFVSDAFREVSSNEFSLIEEKDDVFYLVED